MPSYTAGTAYLRIAPSLQGLHAEINRELRTITPEPVVKVRIEPEWRRGTRIPIPPADRDTEVRVPVRAQVDKKSFSDATVSVAALQRSIVQIAKPVAAVFATPVVFGFATAVEAASRTVLLVPAAVAAAGTVVATFKLGLLGLADAFDAVAKGDPEKIAKAMAKLSPEARNLVNEVIKITPAFKGMQLEVQEALLYDMGRAVSTLAMQYLPTLRLGLKGVAGELRETVVAVLDYARSGRAVGAVATIFDETRKAVHELNFTGADLVAIFLDIAKVGAEFLPDLARWFATGAEQAKIFVANARDTGQLKIWIDSGINAVRDFIKIIVNLGVTLNNVLDAAGMDGFLESLLNITARMREWSASTTGIAQTRDLFSSLSDLGVTLAPRIITIAGTIIKLVQTVGPAIKPLAQGVTDVTAAAAPAVELFTALAVSVLPPLGAALSFLAPVLGPVVAAFIAAEVAIKAWSVVTAAAELVQRGFAITMAIVNGSVMAYNLVAAIVRGNINLWATAQWLLNAAMAANPIGVVVVVLGLLVAALVLAWTHSETFRNIVIGAWEGIKTAVAAVWAWLQQTFADLSTAVTGLGNWFMWLWNDVMVPAWAGIAEAAKLAFVIIATIVITPMYILITQVLGPAFTWLWREVIVPAWEGIRAAIDVAWSFIRDSIWTPIVNFLTAVLGPAQTAFQATTTAAWETIRAGIDVAWNFIRDNIWTPIVNFLAAVLGPAIEGNKILITAAWETIRAGIDVAWTYIRDNIWTPLVTFITVTIPAGFQAGVDAVGRLWDGIKAKLRDPLQAAINVVWNNGIVKVWNMVADLVGLGTKLSPYNLPGFAAGGPVVGGTAGKDSVLLRAMPGEFVFSKAAVDSMGGPKVVERLHDLFRGGGAVRTVPGGARGLPGYQTGGLVVPPVGPNPLAALGDVFGALTSAISGLAGLAGGAGQWGPVVVGFGRKVGTAVLDWLTAKVAAFVASFIGIGGGAPGSGAAGGGGPLVGGAGARGFIIAHESGGNPTARNPTSTASGLYQFINSTWKAYGGSTPTAAQASVAEQNAVADRYVAARYGGWDGAAAYWRVHHNYDRGGIASGAGMMAKSIIRPERVLSNRQTRAFEALVGSLTGPAATSRLAPDYGDGLGGGTPAGGSFIGQLVVSPQPGDSVQDVLDAAMTRARHEFNSGRYGRR